MVGVLLAAALGVVQPKELVQLRGVPEWASSASSLIAAPFPSDICDSTYLVVSSWAGMLPRGAKADRADAVIAFGEPILLGRIGKLIAADVAAEGWTFDVSDTPDTVLVLMVIDGVPILQQVTARQPRYRNRLWERQVVEWFGAKLKLPSPYVGLEARPTAVPWAALRRVPPEFEVDNGKPPAGGGSIEPARASKNGPPEGTGDKK